VKFAFIRGHERAYAVRDLCRVLTVSRSGYYRWRRDPVGRRASRRAELAEAIRGVHEQSRRVYGSPRVHRALLAAGRRVSCNTVARVMKALGIRARTHRRFRVRTTDSRHAHPVAANVLDRRFHAERPDQVWLTDVTYIPTDEGFVYLAGVMDLFSRRIVGWSMAEHLRTELVIGALNMALRARRPRAGLLHHSDRGVQYACAQYRALLRRRGIIVSMSRVGNCYDNAPQESLWGKLKQELVHQHRFATRAQARQAVFEWIEVFYNRQRLHSTLGYLSPERFEALKRGKG
jgi:transposase InsO family protein